jgi:hypothetical protein
VRAAFEGQSLEHEGRAVEARESYRRALEIAPHYALAKTFLGALELAEGNYSAAWPLMEHRALPKQHGGPPRWKGGDLRGKILGVLWEAGLGDQLQFSRFVPVLRARGARVVMICPSQLARIYGTLAGIDQIYPIGAIQSIPHTNMHVELTLQVPDYYIELCSLPLFFGVQLATVPAPPYLRANPDDVERWRARVPQEGFRVGLVWRGGPTNSFDRWRSMPSIAALAPLWRVPGVEFVSVQKGVAAEADARACRLPLTHLGGDLQDMADTAAVMAQLDLMISVDSSPAHLAGALNLPLWVVLDKYPDWRWRKAEMARRWYPTARLFYQEKTGEWGAPIEKMATALAEIVRAPGPFMVAPSTSAGCGAAPGR